MQRSRKGVGSRAWLALAVAAGLGSTTSVLGQEAFTLNAEGNAGNTPSPAVFTWESAPWVGLAGAYPGSNGRTNDTATLTFREFGNTDPAGDAHVDIDLGGLTINLASLSFTESGTGNTDGDFQNGTFNLSTINYTSGGREIDFESNLTVNGVGGTLGVNNSGGSSIDFIGAVNATNFTYTGSGSFIRINQQTTASFANLTLNTAGGAFVIANYDTALGTNFAIDTLAVNGTGKFELDRVNGTLAFGATIASGTTINSSRFRLDANDDDATVTFNGLVTVANGGAGVEIGTEDQRAIINLHAGLAGNEVVTFNLHGPLNGISDHGVVNVLNTGSSRTAATIIQGGRVNLGIDGGLGTGKVTVRDHGFLNLTAEQTALNVDVAEFGAIGGDFSGGTLGGNVTIALQNVVLTQGLTASVVPTRAQTSGAVHWLGLVSNSATATVGDDGDAGTTGDIYKGVAIGQYTGGGTGNFIGTITPSVAGQNMLVLMQVGKQFGASGTATFNTTGSVTFTGPGLVQLNEPDATGTTRAIATAAPGGADVFFRVGDATTQNVTTLRFGDASSLVAGQTFNVTDGRVDLDADNAVAPGAIVNIGAGATLSLDRNFTTGTFRIGDGGALGVASITHINSGATFEVSGTNAILILDADLNITAGSALDSVMRNTDLVLHDGDADDFDGVGLVLGDGKRLATASTQSGDLTGGTGVSAVAGATSVTFSASSGDTLDINDAVNLAGVHLNVGDTSPFNTIVSGGTGSTNFTRALDAQTGTVALNTTTTRSIDLRSGILRFEQGAIAGLKDGSITTAVSGIGGGTTIRDGTSIEIEYNQETDPAGIVINETFFVAGNHNAANSSGRTFILDRNGTVTNGNNIITLSNVVVGDGAIIGVDVQDTGATEGRLGLRLVGNATVTQQGLTGSAQDDFSLSDVSGANADGSPSSAPRTLNLGVTPAGTVAGTTGAPNSSNFIWNGNIFGTVASNVTINAINSQTDFQNGSVLNGVFNVQVRTGDFFMRVRAGADGNAANRLTGSGQINFGHLTGTTVEDIAGFVDEVDVGATPNPALVPIYNATGVQVNILNLTGAGGGNRAILRAERGVNANDVQDIAGTFEFSNVRLETGAIAELQSTNGQTIKASLVLDRGSGAVTANTASQAFLGNVTDPGTPDTLTITGGNSVRVVGNVTAQRLVVGGPGLGGNSGNVVLQSSALSTQVVNSVAYPMLAGPESAGSLTLTDYLDIGQGGNVDVGINGTSNGSYSVSTGVRLSGNGSLDLFAPLNVPGGKRLTGSSTTALRLFSTGTNTGALNVLAGGILAPGDTTGVLTIEGSLQMSDDSIYEYQIGNTPALSDRVDLTGAGTVTFGNDLLLNITNPALADVTGQTYVLYSYAGADPAGLPNIVFTGPLTGDVSMDTSTNQILLTNVVPEPATAGLLAMMAVGLLARRRRKHAR